MLPFLTTKKKSNDGAGITVEYRKSDAESPKDDGGLEATAGDILAAFNANDKKMLAKSLKNFFEICDSIPHEEYNPESEIE